MDDRIKAEAEAARHYSKKRKKANWRDFKTKKNKEVDHWKEFTTSKNAAEEWKEALYPGERSYSTEHTEESAIEIIESAGD